MNNNDLTPIWKALSDPTRREILDLLKEQPRTTGNLCDAFEVSRFAIMKHLSILEKADLIVVRRRGRERWNHLNAIPLQQIYDRWLRPYEAEWASVLLNLKQQIETSKGNELRMTTKSLSELTEIHVEQNVTINASPEVVFDALTQQISVWWTQPFFHSGEAAKRLVLELRPGGRFYEDLGNNEGLFLATVVSIKKPNQLQLIGPMGMTGLVQGSVLFQLESKENSTLLKLSHRAIGDVSDEVKNGYDLGWKELLSNRLRSFIEDGTRYDGT